MDDSIEARELARKLIKRHEGYSSHPIPDAKGTVQIGYGTNLSIRGLSQEEADWLVIRDIARIEGFLSSYGWYSALTPTRKAVLIDMAYNVGHDGFQGFGAMIQALEWGEWNSAAAEMLDSKWKEQVGTRASDDAELMRLG